MLRVMRAGGTRVGTIEECWRQINECSLPEAFKLKLTNHLCRQMNEISALQKGIEEESGFEADTTSYLNILLAKEESDLMRRVSHCRCLKQVSTYDLFAAWPFSCSCVYVFSRLSTYLPVSLLLDWFHAILAPPRVYPAGPLLSGCRALSGTLHTLSCVCVRVSSHSLKPSNPHTSIEEQRQRLLCRRQVRSKPAWMDGCGVQHQWCRSSEFRSSACVSGVLRIPPCSSWWMMRHSE